MAPRKPVPERSADEKLPSSVEVLRHQREANEKLVLSGLLAHKEADELRGIGDELRATAEFRERLIGIVGHDLRSPLNVMVMASGLLIARGDLSEADAKLATQIVTSGQRMARMISQLVEFTRVRLGGDFDLKLAPGDLGEVCRDIAAELRIGTSTEIRLKLEGDLRGTLDSDRLAEAVSNIANNAVDHSTPGTPVLLHAHEDGAMIVAEITNQGRAIPPEVLPIIFNAFRRGEVKAGPKAGSLGLGLYIASQIVRAHGGTLTARSSDGSTSFTIRLPRAYKPAPPLA